MRLFAGIGLLLAGVVFLPAPASPSAAQEAETWQAANRASVTAFRDGDLDTARRLARRALALYEGQGEGSPDTIAGLHINLADMIDAAGPDRNGLRRQLEILLDGIRRIEGLDLPLADTHEALILLHDLRAQIWVEGRAYVEAVRSRQHIINTLGEVYGENHFRVVEAELILVNMLAGTGEARPTRDALKRLAARMRQADLRAFPELRWAYRLLEGRTYLLEYDYEKAERVYRALLEGLDMPSDSARKYAAVARQHLAHVLCQAGREDALEELLLKIAQEEDGGRTFPVIEISPELHDSIRHSGNRGAVTLSYRVDAAGRPVDVKIAESTAMPVYEKDVLKAFADWRFAPALADGVPTVSESKTLTFSYYFYGDREYANRISDTFRPDNYQQYGLISPASNR